VAEDNNYTRPVLPTPFDDEPEQKKKTKKQPKRDDDSVMEDVRKSLRETVVVPTSERRTSYPPQSERLCVRCNEPGAGSPYKGEFYHMSCKLEAKREDDEL